jgi:hypothetical protein
VFSSLGIVGAACEEVKTAATQIRHMMGQVEAPEESEDVPQVPLGESHYKAYLDSAYYCDRLLLTKQILLQMTMEQQLQVEASDLE